MRVVLDTDHLSLLQTDEQPATAVLRSRLAPLAEQDILASIISFQEQAQGWLAYLRRARKPADVLTGFSFLHDLLKRYAADRVLAFDQLALDEFLRLKQQRIRIGTNDLRIASIAKANGMKLLSRNLRDFRQVPGLYVEDWAA